MLFHTPHYPQESGLEPGRHLRSLGLGVQGFQEPEEWGWLGTLRSPRFYIRHIGTPEPGFPFQGALGEPQPFSGLFDELPVVLGDDNPIIDLGEKGLSLTARSPAGCGFSLHDRCFPGEAA